MVFESTYNYNHNEVNYRVNVFHTSDNNLRQSPVNSLFDVNIDIDGRDNISFPLGFYGDKDTYVQRQISYWPFPILSGIPDISNAFQMIIRTIKNDFYLTTRTIELQSTSETFKNVKINKLTTPIELTTCQRFQIVLLSIATFVRGIFAAFCLGFLFIGPDYLFQKFIELPYYASKKEALWSQLKAPSNISNVSSTKIEEFIETLKTTDGVKIQGNKVDTWHEIVFDGNPYEKSKVKCPWKLHISPGTDILAILDVLKPVLLKNKPYCKIVQNQEKLVELENTQDVNGHKVYKGKCLTIYPKSEQEAITLAVELNAAIAASNLINNDTGRQPCSDRPLGKSGYLWTRNDLAGGPIDESSFKSSDHAHAMPGNYDTTVILPMQAYDFETDERGRKAYTEWYNREFPNFRRIVHKDIFKESFGDVHWVGTSQSDQGRFETT